MTKIDSERILEEIEKRNVVPLPRWYFIARSALFWGLAVISVITGAISMATAVYVFLDNDYVTDHANIDTLFEQRPLLEIIVQSIPYVWLLALTLFIIVAYYGFRHTRRGYRYPMLRVISGSLLMSMLLCGVMNAFDVGRLIHRYLIENIQSYNRLVNTNEILWVQTAKGLLGGKIVEYPVRDSLVIIRDYKKRLWRVDISRAEVRTGTKLVVGKYLKITGLKTGKGEFRAHSVRPWRNKRR